MPRGLPQTVKDNIEKCQMSALAAIEAYNRPEKRFRIAHAAIQFIGVDEASEEELKRLEKLNVLIKEKNIPIQNLNLFRPNKVVSKVNAKSIYKLTLNGHAAAWRHFNVRPPKYSQNPKNCVPEYCVYDEAHGDYVYTSAWVSKLIELFSNYKLAKNIIQREPVKN